tara:strand:- start:1074 stop:1904 length:831 start_codon:yes stop_codon:yes gene_type:complete
MSKILKIPSDKKYLKINFSLSKTAGRRSYYGPGLSDQLDTLLTYIAFANHCDMILILPIRELTGIHNEGRSITTNLTNYFDFSKLKINNKKVSVIENENEVDADSIHQIQAQHPKIVAKLRIEIDFQNLNIVLPRCSYHIQIANEIITNFNLSASIHIRRTDKLNPELRDRERWGVSAKTWDEATSESNVIELSKHLNINNDCIYIMTDMLEDDKVVKRLKESNINYIFYFDIPKLVELKNKNNYDLYNIECEILSQLKVSVSRTQLLTFYTQSKI